LCTTSLKGRKFRIGLATGTCFSNIRISAQFHIGAALME